MTRIILLIVGALLALTSSVDAKSKKDRIHLYHFYNTACESAPTLGNMDLERDECVTFESAFTKAEKFGLKPMLDPQRPKWKKDVEDKKIICHIALYSGHGCNGTATVAPLPEYLETCLPFDLLTAKSVKFECPRKETVTTITETIPPKPEQTIQPRNVARNEEKHAWMKHPWAESYLCYRCWTRETNDLNHFDCLDTADESACGPKHFDEAGKPSTKTIVGPTSTSSHVVVNGILTTTSTAISITTTHPPSTTVVTGTTTMTSVTTFVSTVSAALEERKSWHRNVILSNPWTGQKMCADAEWEKRGKPNTEIRVQKARLYDAGKCENRAIVIDAPAVITKTVFSTATASGYTNIVTVTETTTVSVGTDHGASTTFWVRPSSSSAAEARQAEDDSIPHSDL